MGMKYSLAVTLWKAVWVWAVATFGVGSAVVVASEDLPAAWDTFAANWQVLLVAIVPAVYKAIDNLRKNYRGGGVYLWHWPWEVLFSKGKM